MFVAFETADVPTYVTGTAVQGLIIGAGQLYHANTLTGPVNLRAVKNARGRLQLIADWARDSGSPSAGSVTDTWTVDLWFIPTGGPPPPAIETGVVNLSSPLTANYRANTTALTYTIPAGKGGVYGFSVNIIVDTDPLTNVPDDGRLILQVRKGGTEFAEQTVLVEAGIRHASLGRSVIVDANAGEVITAVLGVWGAPRGGGTTHVESGRNDTYMRWIKFA